MYGDPFQAKKYKFDQMAIEDMKELPITLETADVFVNSECKHEGMNKEQLLKDTEGEVDGEH